MYQLTAPRPGRLVGWVLARSPSHGLARSTLMYCMVQPMGYSRRGRPALVLAVAVGTLLVGCASRGPAGSSTTTSSSPAGFAAPGQLPARQSWAPWPSALHDARHSGASVSAGPTAGVLRWQRHLEAAVTPGPVVGPDGTIYVASNAGVLHALNPTTGADLWTFGRGGPYAGETDLSTSPLVLPQGSILWPGPADTLYELSSVGQLLWSHRFDGMVLSPALAGTSVYVGLMSWTVWELNVSGTLTVIGWSTSIGHSSFGSPGVSPDGDV